MTVASPCTSVCRMNAGNGWCEGCFRTLDEIAEWSGMDEAAKRQVLQQITQRKDFARDAVSGLAEIPPIPGSTADHADSLDRR